MRVIFLSLLCLSQVGVAEHLVTKTRPSGAAYFRPSRATAGMPVPSSAPIPLALDTVLGHQSTLSATEKIPAELQAYLEDPAYQRYMKEKIWQAAQRLPESRRAKYENMELSQLVQEWFASNPEMNTTQMAVQLAVLEVGASSVLGGMDADLCKTSETYSDQLGRAARQMGHHNWNSRSGVLRQKYAREGFHVEANENEAESSHGIGTALMPHAQECVRSWWYSSGHKAAMEKYHTLTCHTMSADANGRYYCIGQFIDQTGR